MSDKWPVVRNVQNDDLYFYLGENKFRNIRTGNEGTLTDEQAQKLFKINLHATQLIHEFPLIAELLQIKQLKIDNNKN